MERQKEQSINIPSIVNDFTMLLNARLLQLATKLNSEVFNKMKFGGIRRFWYFNKCTIIKLSNHTE